MTQKIINIAKVLLSKKAKLVFLFNFHRIGTVNKKNPFHLLHTVSEKLFRIQIRFLSLFGEFVSLNDIRDYKNLSKINFSVTFDDGSRTVLKIVPYLREKSIPYAICLSTEVLEKGYGIRDDPLNIECAHCGHLNWISPGGVPKQCNKCGKALPPPTKIPRHKRVGKHGV